MSFVRHLPRRHIVFALLFLPLAAVSVVAAFAWLLADLPPVSAAAARMTRPTTQILDRNGRLLYEVIDSQAGKQIDLNLDDIPVACIQATIATEDQRFYRHPGFDPIAIGRAAWQNMRAGGHVVSGASTISQQLARNLLMDVDERYEQSLQRKAREAWLAWRLEQHYTKDQLLALYLNQTYYGNWAFGLEAAAQVFFAKPARQLSRGECALLTGLIQYPSGYNPLLDPDAAKGRQLTILRLMREAGFLDTAAMAQIAGEPLRYRSNLFGIAAPHFVMVVQDLLVDRLGIERLRAGGLQVTTTLDLGLQEAAETAIRHRLDQLNCRAPGVCDDTTDPNRRVDNAAAVVLDSQTGAILAMVGSPDYFDPRIQGNVNAAVSLRQPGSAIKPLTYAAALDPEWSRAAGQPPLTAASVIADLPTTFYTTDASGGNVPYVPLNYDRSFHGPVSVRTALANSYNIPAVKTLDRIGVEQLQGIAAAAGISTFTGDYGLALTLGGGEVTLLELAAAYGILDDGRRLEPHALLAVDDAAGNPVGQALPPRPHARATAQVIDPATAYLITDILSDAEARRPAFGRDSVLDLPFPAAAKTGTTTDWRDNWTVGYSTARIVGVWVGNADNAPMLDVSGIDGAGPIWRDLMLAAHAAPPAPFPRPEGLETVTVCALSGMLPSPACPRRRTELFITGTAPQTVDNQFIAVAVDQSTGQRASVEMPSAQVDERVFWQLPPEYHDWMVSQRLPFPPPVAAPAGNDRQHAEVAVQAGAPLALVVPTSNTAYQLHPGVPADRQRLRAGGYAIDGAAWTALRLVKDGALIAEVHDAGRVETWWQLTPGTHHFWLEGEPSPGATTVRSAEALVVVD